MKIFEEIFSFITYAYVYKSLFMSSVWLFEFYSKKTFDQPDSSIVIHARGTSLLQICLHLPSWGGYFTVGSVGSTTRRQPLWNVYFRYHDFSDGNEENLKAGQRSWEKVQGNTQQHSKTKQNLSLLRLSSVIYSCRPQKGFHYNMSLIHACDSP